MKEKRIRLHYYTDEVHKRRFISDISVALKREQYSGIKWYLKRDWRYGQHIGIYIIPNDALRDLEQNFVDEIIALAQRHWEKTQAIEVMASEDVLRQLNTLETNGQGKDESFLPIAPNKSCVVEELDLEPSVYFSHIKEFELFKSKRCESAGLLIETIDYIEQINEEDQYLLLVALLAHVADCYPKFGREKGCISFKSHIIGFFANPDSRTEILKVKFDGLYRKVEPRLQKLYENDFMIDECRDLILGWNGFFRRFIEDVEYDDQIKNEIRNDSKLEKESKQNLSNYSDFHNKWVNRDSFKDFFYSEEFYRYRLLVNFFYMMLPNMGIGPVGKHLGCYFITRIIEETEGIKFNDKIAQDA